MAAVLADLLEDGDLIVLSGDLGAGKTCFTQGLGRALGITDRITSPTFTLANRYEGALTLNHLDVYRIEQLADTLDLDLPELMEEGVTVIEWGEQILPILGDDFLLVRIRHSLEPDSLEPDSAEPDSAEPDSAEPDRDGADELASTDYRMLEIELHGACWARRRDAVRQRLAEWPPC